MLPDTIDLILKAKHFEDTDFDNCYKCAVSKAIKEQVLLNNCDNEDVETYIKHVWIMNRMYDMFPLYYVDEFEADKESCINKSPETVIRTITLTRRTN